MKKILILLLLLTLTLSMVMTGCAKSDSASETDQPDAAQTEQSADTGDADTAEAAGNVNTEGMGDLLSAAYVDMMQSNEYTMKYRFTLGEGDPMDATVSVKGSDMAMTSNMFGAESIVILKGDKVYMLDPASKTAMVYTQTAEDMEMMKTSTFDAAGVNFVGRGNEDGLVYEEYTAPEIASLKYYFDGEKLVKIYVDAVGGTIVMDILEMSKDVPADAFEIPADYTVTELEDGLGE